MYVLDFYDIMFFCKALKQPSAHFNILDFVQFSCTNTIDLHPLINCSMFILLATTRVTFVLLAYLDYGIAYHLLILTSRY